MLRRRSLLGLAKRMTGRGRVEVCRVIPSTPSIISSHVWRLGVLYQPKSSAAGRMGLAGEKF